VRRGLRKARSAEFIEIRIYFISVNMYEKLYRLHMHAGVKIKIKIYNNAVSSVYHN
jgi:hypothetical protein